MSRSDDRAYYARRIEASLRLAREASDPAVRNIHLKMAAEYRILASRAVDEQSGERARDPRVREVVSAAIPVNGSRRQQTSL